MFQIPTDPSAMVTAMVRECIEGGAKAKEVTGTSWVVTTKGSAVTEMEKSFCVKLDPGLGGGCPAVFR